MGDRNLKNFIRKKKEKAKLGFANVLEIPEDILLNLPRVVMVGNVHVYIENHKGVIEYTSEKLRVAVNSGEIKITGEDFFLKTILPDELSLEGKIDTLVFGQ
ncbi:MAG: sporulation protein YqfC [Clostridia bacterium]|nr:sporulation protein YqfC [Clostridia bacterium]